MATPFKKLHFLSQSSKFQNITRCNSRLC